MTGRTRLSDIAECAGVSITTVARVLSGTGRNIRVSDERAAAIRAIAERMNYQPNITARTLAGRESRVIGILADSRAPGVQVRTLAEIEREAGRHGYRVMVGEAHDSYESLRDSCSILLQHGVDGLIIMAHDYPGVAGTIGDYLKPSARMVFIDRPRLEDASFVEIDRAYGILSAVEALARRGRKRIAMLTDSVDYISVMQRVDGYRRGMARFCPDVEDLLIRIPMTGEPVDLRGVCARLIGEFIRPQRVDCLILHNDLYAVAMLTELRLAGIAVPGELSVIGCDNDDYDVCVDPQLTSIDENGATTAIQAVKMLLEGLNDPEGEFVARQALVKPKLVLRQSV